MASGLVSAAAAALPLVVDSCGTISSEGHPAPTVTIEAARELGVDLTSHRSRFLGSCDLAGKDLVIGFERSHVAGAVVEGGAVPERTFLLLELVRLLRGGDPPHEVDPLVRARAVVAEADALRASSGFVPGEEIPDPIGKPIQVHREVARELSVLTREVLDRLFGGVERA